MKATIKEVAKEAGVSISTVSRVINGQDRVSKSTLRKVQTAIEKLQFRPDPVARTMINKKTLTVGLVVPQLSNEYWSSVSETIQDELWSCGYTTMICSTDNRPEKERAYLNMFIERRVDGILYCPSSLDAANIQEQIAALKASGIPLVTLDRSAPGVSCVVGDHMAGAFSAVEHLIRLGYRRIAYIGGPAVSIEREFGYRKALMMHGLSADEALVRLVDGASYADGYGALQSLLAADASFDALFCGNDLLAFGAIKALDDAGRRVPEDAAVVGYDDIFSARLFKPALTTVRQPIAEIGKELVTLLLQSMEPDSNGRSPRKIVIPTELVVRESSGGTAQQG